MLKLQKSFNVPITPKIHIVFQHLSESFAQAKPHKNDWCSTVKNDIIDFDLNLSFEDIKALSNFFLEKWSKMLVKRLLLTIY